MANHFQVKFLDNKLNEPIWVQSFSFLPVFQRGDTIIFPASSVKQFQILSVQHVFSEWFHPMLGDGSDYSIKVTVMPVHGDKSKGIPL